MFDLSRHGKHRQFLTCDGFESWSSGLKQEPGLAGAAKATFERDISIVLQSFGNVTHSQNALDNLE